MLHSAAGKVLPAASFTPNIGPFMEFKGNAAVPIECESSSLRCEGGIVRVPSGPGWGLRIDPDFVDRTKVVSVS